MAISPRMAPHSHRQYIEAVCGAMASALVTLPAPSSRARFLGFNQFVSAPSFEYQLARIAPIVQGDGRQEGTIVGLTRLLQPSAMLLEAPGTLGSPDAGEGIGLGGGNFQQLLGVAAHQLALSSGV